MKYNTKAYYGASPSMYLHSDAWSIRKPSKDFNLDSNIPPKSNVFVPNAEWIFVVQCVLASGGCVLYEGRIEKSMPSSVKNERALEALDTLLSHPHLLTKWFYFDATRRLIHDLKKQYNLSSIPEFRERDFYDYDGRSYNPVTTLLKTMQWTFKNKVKPSLEFFK